MSAPANLDDLLRIYSLFAILSLYMSGWEHLEGSYSTLPIRFTLQPRVITTSMIRDTGPDG